MSTFSRHGRAQASLALLIWLIEKVGPAPTFSRHGRAQASLALLIWLIEKVLQDIGIQNVSWRGSVAGYTTDVTWRFETDRYRCRRRPKRQLHFIDYSISLIYRTSLKYTIANILIHPYFLVLNLFVPEVKYFPLFCFYNLHIITFSAHYYCIFTELRKRVYL